MPYDCSRMLSGIYAPRPAVRPTRCDIARTIGLLILSAA